MVDRSRSVGGDTRREVMTQLLGRGPVSASELGEVLGLSAAGVRRHLDALVEEGLAQICEPNAVAGAEVGRGRPAKHYRLTQLGRSQFGNSYDVLALDALDALEQLGGEEAVRAFARRRAETILGGVDANGDVEDVVDQVVAAFEAHGYTATASRAAGGVQICQHHCPVQSVAAAHPELCEAEHEAISELVGSHVQPLALIADGNGLCTTNIPLNTGNYHTNNES
ncbi:metalloregulator ArsR/SmtB family transcription factor [Corynebacterium sp. HMSC29G08]|uniref:helix-turn-helix transcriptional regulator n=1 Tax=Corynebacterium sp. HMSC29G08 TaxID=1581069 RepID=UPI0008A5DB6E|nr:helix-turn-helix domain-containing protein [Corynebacterium sp. HMSC29G08]OFT85855.1 transcriptional regulator [Corynebacterium sp. HMSC29G08]